MNAPIYLMSDFYKLSHREQYPKGTQKVYSTLTPRSNKYGVWSDGVVVFGIQYFIKEYLMKRFDEEFFSKPLEEVIETYSTFVENTLGKKPDTTHLEKLHKLGYLPLKIDVVEEGTFVPVKTPIMTIENTHSEFFWLTNYIETILSTTIWQPITSATLAYQYRKILDEYALKTVGSTDYVDFQGHDFSMRGMSSEQTAMTSGMGHLLSFSGSDTIPAIFGANHYYNAELTAKTGTSIPATEHSVMCSYGKTNELELFRHLIEGVYPEGIFSVVSDTWDFWKVVTEYLPKLKETIMSRNGKVVIRPDSGDPIKIICGDTSQVVTDEETKAINKGLIESLWDTFGGTVNEKGYKVLDQHIGAIYGDSITIERAEEILKQLKEKGFASSNIVFGIGSYSYQYHTRDTFGFAVKATDVVVNKEERKIFKDPKTDDGTKRSQRGRVFVERVCKDILWTDDLTADEYEKFANDENRVNLFETVFLNGELIKNRTFEDVRITLKNNI